jgi:predicted DNA-binding WGR domain protein
MDIAKVSLTHRGGTKEYFLTLVCAPGGSSIVIRRWGAKGALGQLKVTKFVSQKDAEKDFEKELNARQSGSKGYQVTDSKELQVASPEELARAIGRTVMPKIGAANMQHIDPTFDTTGMRDPEQTREEDGTPIDTRRRVQLTPEQEAEIIEQERMARLAPVKAHPDFGRF